MAFLPGKPTTDLKNSTFRGFSPGKISRVNQGATQVLKEDRIAGVRFAIDFSLNVDGLTQKACRFIKFPSSFYLQGKVVPCRGAEIAVRHRIQSQGAAKHLLRFCVAALPI